MATHPFVALDPADVSTLRTAADLAKKAGEAAAKACEKAELTMESSGARELVGYADEVLYRLDRMQNGRVELPSKHRAVLSTGIRLYIAKLQKMKSDQEELFVDTEEVVERAGQVIRVALKIGATNVPELDLEPAGVGEED